MPQAIIDVGFDVEKFTEQQQVVVNGLREFYDAAKKAEGTNINFGSAGGYGELKTQIAALKESITQLEQANRSYAQSQQQAAQANTTAAQSTSRVSQSTKQLTSDQALLNVQNKEDVQNLRVKAQLENSVANSIEQSVNQVKVYQQELTILNNTTDANISRRQQLLQMIAEEQVKQEGLKQEQKQVTQAFIDQANAMRLEQQALIAGGPLLAQLRADLKSLEADRETKITIADPAQLDEVNAKIKAIKTQIDTIEQAGGNFRGNVGNYANSLQTLFQSVGTEIQRLKGQMDSLNQEKTGDPSGFAIRGGDAEIQRTTQAISELQQVQKIALNTSQSFNQTLNQTQQAFIGIAQGGAQDSQFLTKFKNDITDVQQKLSSIGNFSNKSNFTESIKILEAALAGAKQRLNELTQAEKQNTTEGQAAQREVELLTTLVGQQEVGFTTLAREVMRTGQQVATLHEQMQVLERDGLQNTEAYSTLKNTLSTLNTEYTNAKRKVTEFQMEQKILTDTAPKIAALTAAARGLGGIYATGAGAAALFANGNEKVAERLNQLVAVMTLLQGLNEIHHLAMEKNAIATALFGSSTAATTVALEGEAVGAEAATVATGGLSKALAFIEANPIVLALGLLAAAIITITSGLHDEEYQLKKTAEAEKEYSDAVKTSTTTIEDQNKLLDGNLIKQQDKLKAELASAQSSGANQEKILSLTKAIDVISDSMAAKTLKSLPEINSELDDQEKHLKSLYDEQIKVNDEVKKYGKELRDAPKKVESGLPFGIGDLNLSKKALDDAKERQKINDEAVRSGEANRNELIKQQKDAEDAHQKTLDDDLKSQKFFSDEERRLILSTAEQNKAVVLAEAQTEANAIEDKNNKILANEHSTLQERLNAIKSNSDVQKSLIEAEVDQQKKLAAVQLANVTTNKSSTGADIKIANDQYRTANLVAENEYYDKVRQIDSNGEEEKRKLLEQYGKRDLEAAYNILKSKLQLEVSMNEKIMNNTAVDTNGQLIHGLDERIEATRNYYEDQKQMVVADANLQKATKVLTDNELLALDTETKNKLIEIDQSYREKIHQAELKAKEDHKKAVQDETVNEIKNTYDAQLAALDDAHSKGLITDRKYNTKKIAIQAELQIALLKNEIEITKNQLDQQKLRMRADDAQLDHEIRIAEARANLETDPEKKKADLQAVADARAAANQLEQADDDAIQASKTKLAALEISLVNLVANIRKQKGDDAKKDWKDVFDSIAGAAIQAADIISQALDIGITKQKNAIQALEDTQQKNYESEVSRINNSSLSDQKKAELQIELEAKRNAQKEQNDRRQKQLDIQKAKFDKAKGIAEIALNTAVAVVKALPNIAEAIIVGAIGAAELAIAAATPVPTYGEGTDDHPGGVARYGEKGAERITLPGGKSFIATKETIGYLPAHTKVEPLSNELVNDAMNGSMVDSVAERLMIVEAVERKRNSNDNWKIANYQSERFEKALEKNNKSVVNKINVINDFGWIEYLNKKVFGRK